MTPKKKTPPAAEKPTRASAGAAKSAAAAAIAKAPPPRPTDIQLANWNKAMQMFSQRRFEDALPLFRETAMGPAVHVADKARSYEQICLRQSARPQAEFRTPDDHFYYGVERMNARDLAQAQKHLSMALKLQPDGDHILYAIALCCGLSGDGTGACENLKRAIDLEPRNRVIARQDSEFALVADQFPGVRALLSSSPAAE
jgi:hypothetical protein